MFRPFRILQKQEELLPHAPLETPILNRLSEILFANVFRPVEISKGADDLDDAAVTEALFITNNAIDSVNKYSNFI